MNGFETYSLSRDKTLIFKKSYQNADFLSIRFLDLLLKFLQACNSVTVKDKEIYRRQFSNENLISNIFVPTLFSLKSIFTKIEAEKLDFYASSILTINLNRGGMSGAETSSTLFGVIHPTILYSYTEVEISRRLLLFFALFSHSFDWTRI